jgi:hypothetical protein
MFDQFDYNKSKLDIMEYLIHKNLLLDPNNNHFYIAYILKMNLSI